MGTNYTPGPWTTEKNVVGGLMVRTSTGSIIAGGSKTANADVRLIAAAPELVEALVLAHGMVKELEALRAHAAKRATLPNGDSLGNYTPECLSGLSRITAALAKAGVTP